LIGRAVAAAPPDARQRVTGFFITDDGYLISNYHVVKDAAKVRLLTGLRRDEVATATQAGAGLIDAKVVQVDAAPLSRSSRREEAHYSSRRSLSLLTSAATVESGGADPRLLNK
jgi:S1-C subfamily serine protease